MCSPELFVPIYKSWTERRNIRSNKKIQHRMSNNMVSIKKKQKYTTKQDNKVNSNVIYINWAKRRKQHRKIRRHT